MEKKKVCVHCGKKADTLARTLAITYCIGFTSTVLVIAGLANLGTTGHQILMWFEQSTAPIIYAQVQTGTTTEQIVIEQKEKMPSVLQRIAYCESKGKQYDGKGNTTRGRITPSDLGKFQINEVYWGQKAHDLGFDLYTEKGNEQMAQYIYQEHGTWPWDSSSKCWK